jgi:amino acid adenylation domain-containing protein
VVQLSYDTRRFDSDTIARTLDHFERALVALAEAADAPLRELSLISDRERRQLVLEWNDTAVDFPRDARAHELFQQQVRRTPNAPALVFGGSTLTYADLDRQVDEMAHRLRALGVGAETLVGLCVERSADMVVALLGVLAAGGAYLPLAPEHPQERLAYMLDDARVGLLIVDRATRDRFAGRGPRLLTIGEDSERAGVESQTAPVGRGTSAAAAYVIYTSGSTGRPKGVVVPHQALVGFLASMARRPGLGAGDTVVATTTLSFDIAALELLLPLTVGAKVVVVAREIARDGALLAATIREHRATLLQATPATWRILIEAGWRGQDGLKVLCGGEAMSVGLADALLERAAEVWNVYGPTETTVWSSVHRLERRGVPPVIGQPIENTQIYVLDAALEPVPVGVVGELCIGGVGVARGYLGRPALTAERFVPDPLGPAPGARLYRTGDHGRVLADGTLEYLGRGDHQVKVRGFRIELGEVEETLRRQPGVRQAVTAVSVDPSGENRLVAYVVSSEASAFDAGGLRARLRATLPEYMVPSVIVPLAALPLTPNGKVDRKALPAPVAAREQLGLPYVAPRTPEEDALAAIWREALGLERVGVDDNFFALGGHSLVATLVASRIRSELGVDVPLKLLFELPTIGGLVAALTAAGAWPQRPHADAAGDEIETGVL